MMNRRTALTLLTGSVCVPRMALAATPREIGWDDLIPEGLPYAEIIGEGDIDAENDTWAPIYDENAIKLNEDLNGALIRMPGYIIPLETSPEGVSDFMLVPYVGACLHTPPPPANQLVMVNTADPWPNDNLWDPVWVTGLMHTQLQSTSLGQTGYALTADNMEIYTW